MAQGEKRKGRFTVSPESRPLRCALCQPLLLPPRGATGTITRNFVFEFHERLCCHTLHRYTAYSPDFQLSTKSFSPHPNAHLFHERQGTQEGPSGFRSSFFHSCLGRGGSVGGLLARCLETTRKKQKEVATATLERRHMPEPPGTILVPGDPGSPRAALLPLFPRVNFLFPASEQVGVQASAHLANATTPVEIGNTG